MAQRPCHRYNRTDNGKRPNGIAVANEESGDMPPVGIVIANNISVMSGSNCERRGMPLAAVAADYDGRPRGLLAPTLGAFEVPEPGVLALALFCASGCPRHRRVSMRSGNFPSRHSN